MKTTIPIFYLQKIANAWSVFKCRDGSICATWIFWRVEVLLCVSCSLGSKQPHSWSKWCFWPTHLALHITATIWMSYQDIAVTLTHLTQVTHWLMVEIIRPLTFDWLEWIFEGFSTWNEHFSITWNFFRSENLSAIIQENPSCSSWKTQLVSALFKQLPRCERKQVLFTSRFLVGTTSLAWGNIIPKEAEKSWQNSPFWW